MDSGFYLSPGGLRSSLASGLQWWGKEYKNEKVGMDRNYGFNLNHNSRVGRHCHLPVPEEQTQKEDGRGFRRRL
jgi:hypothetical protein